MKVYILYYQTPYDHDDFCGVFSTKEKAQERIDQYCKSDRSQFFIDEEELDERLR